MGYNIAKALITLGEEVTFLSVIGGDQVAQQVRMTMEAEDIPLENVLSLMPDTAQSVIIYDPEGKRQIHTDLFSSFLNACSHSGDPYMAIQKAVLFASFKIGEKGAAEGFLTYEALENLYQGRNETHG